MPACIDEARALRERFDPSLPAFSAIGYREAWAVLDGELTRDAAIELDARRNVAFAKRQRTWFRSEPDITWLDADDESARHPRVRARSASRRAARARSLRARDMTRPTRWRGSVSWIGSLSPDRRAG